MTDPSKKLYADVVFPFPPLRTLTYTVPDRLRDELRPGHRVLVPLGRRRVFGFIVGFAEQSAVSEVKPVEDILDPYPLFTPDMLKLTAWVSDYYLASWGETLRTALPPGLAGSSQLMIEKLNRPLPDDYNLSDLEKTVLLALPTDKKTRLRELEKKTGQKNIRYALNSLENRGLLRQEYVLETGTPSIKTEKWISLVKEPDPEDLERMKKRSPKQTEALSILLEMGGEVQRNDLEADISMLRRLEAAGWIEIWEEEVFRDAYDTVELLAPTRFELTDHQVAAVRRIQESLDSGAFQTFLLHGVTGSGKTQVYIEAVRRCLGLGKQVLILIPEIALTPQAVRRYRAAFGEEVVVLHSRQSRGERFDAWRKLRDGRANIALGTRSAVFAPLSKLGLIVVDEEHEPSYKQHDPAPRYNGRDTALVRGQLAGCTVVLGSATPSLESYANAASGKYALCELPERIDHIPMPKVVLVNQKEAARNTESRIFTPLLIRHIRDRLVKNEQVVLLQNRRGYAAYLRCTLCGKIDACPHCAISLTYHQTDRRMKCHYCGFQRPPFDVCPDCGGSSVQYKGTGTQRIEEEIRCLFPEARLLRMDLDTMRKKGAHSKVIAEFEKRKGDILLGTQIVAKGHDFPGVTLVGIVSADIGLYFPDFRSNERTFQLLTQAAGRAGRKDKMGEVVIQTLSPDHPALQFVRTHDYKVFFNWEMHQRGELGYPPFGRIAMAVFKGPTKDQTEKAAVQFSGLVKNRSKFEVLGPAPAPLARIKDQFRYQIVFRQSKKTDPSGKTLKDALKNALTAFHAGNPNHRYVRIHVDMDPIDMM
jgi:primosomal protein N' (replication factor Y)